jgi:hypothetical protein
MNLINLEAVPEIEMLAKKQGTKFENLALLSDISKKLRPKCIASLAEDRWRDGHESWVLSRIKEGLELKEKNTTTIGYVNDQEFREAVKPPLRSRSSKTR